MNDMSAVIIPKSDQISADDLIAGPITIRISAVEIRPGTEQPVSIHFEDDSGRPWKPCKSMSRVLVAAWGPDAKNYAGRDVTLYRDPTVKWGGMEVGGIRISHMSHMERPMTIALTATKGSRKPFVVKPMAQLRAAVAPSKTATDPLADLEAALMVAQTPNACTKIIRDFQTDPANSHPTADQIARYRAMVASSDARFAGLPDDPAMDGEREL
jgi:hypothetical protein